MNFELLHLMQQELNQMRNEWIDITNIRAQNMWRVKMIKYGNQFNRKGLRHLRRKHVRNFTMQIKNLSNALRQSNMSRMQLIQTVRMYQQALAKSQSYHWIIPRWYDEIKVWLRRNFSRKVTINEIKTDTKGQQSSGETKRSN